MKSATEPTDFNPRSPCGERLKISKNLIVKTHFNPRSPCGERLGGRETASKIIIFQSTLPVWGATGRGDILRTFHRISIHAPRVGSDLVIRLGGRSTNNFNPRSPCGERLAVSLISTIPCLHFNPRSPCGERPVRLRHFTSNNPFQSTLPVWGATVTRQDVLAINRFQSTLPVWGAT